MEQANKDEYERLKGKRVAVFLIEPRGFCYRGRLIEVGDRFVNLYDEKHGDCLVSLNSIRNIQEDEVAANDS